VKRAAKPPLLDELGPGHAVIEASAGTGKTFTLEHLVVELILERGARIDEILVVTFTERATAELVGRVREKIESLLGDFDDAPDGAPAWRIDDAARARLKQALLSFDTASISTIHAFCQRVLTEQAFAGRRLFEQKQVDDRTAFGRAFKDVLRRELAVDERARETLEAWLRAGKRIDDLEQLLYDCQAARAPITPRYDRAAIDDALDHFPALTPAEIAGLGFDRYAIDRLCELTELIAAWREDRDTPGLLAALDAAETDRQLFGTLRRKLAAPSKPRGIEVAAKALAIDAVLVSLPNAAALQFLPRVAARLAERKRDEGLFDFQDMLGLVEQSLTGPDGERLCALLRERWRFALIDEFQDTDEVQWRIFERLFFQAPDRPLYLIGDPKQAIYGFRGADVQTYLAARAQVVAAGGRCVSLDHNFRTTAPLIEAYNAILSQSAEPPFFSGEIDYRRPVACGKPSLTTTDADGREVAPVVLFGIEPEGGESLRAAEIRRRLGARIAAEIRAILDGALRFDGKKIEPKDIFLLTRTGQEGHELGRALRSAAIPHAYYKQDGLFQTDEARQIRDLLAAVDEPHSQSRRFAAWATPFFGVPLAALPRCEELPASHPLVERLFGWKAIADTRDYERLFGAILDESGLLMRAAFVGDGDETLTERALTNHQHIFELLLEQVARVRPTLRELNARLHAYIERAALPDGVDANVQRIESERSAVQIMTLHKSKGLEAKVVFLYGGFTAFGSWSKPRLYHEGGRRLANLGKPRDEATKRRVDEESRQENERLLYVGLTRAKARLYLPCFAENAYGRLDGGYKLLDDRLQQLLDHPRFVRERLGPPAPALTLVPNAAGEWHPPEALLAVASDDARFEALRQSAAGFQITSYTRMKREQPRAAIWDARDRDDEARTPVADGGLPGGASTGRCLHEVLERIDLASLREGAIDPWRERADVRDCFDAALARHDLDKRHRPEAERLVWSALTTPIKLGPLTLDGGLGRVEVPLREMEFLHPAPGGFVRGFIDLLFQHDGRAWLVDWKSDGLPDYGAATVGERVESHYALQARLYALAVAKMLSVKSAREYQARFGGVGFCFLRGLASSGEGLFFVKPSWNELRALEVGE
jgi:exodeoxyribonuclease V beta subunit